MDNLIEEVVSCEDTLEVSRTLLNAAYGKKYILSEEQFGILANIFSESEIVAAVIIYLHNFDEFNEDYEKIKDLYEKVHEKFVEQNSIFSGVKKINA
jgi:hypothetical protein